MVSQEERAAICGNEGADRLVCHTQSLISSEMGALGVPVLLGVVWHCEWSMAQACQ